MPMVDEGGPVVGLSPAGPLSPTPSLGPEPSPVRMCKEPEPTTEEEGNDDVGDSAEDIDHSSHTTSSSTTNVTPAPPTNPTDVGGGGGGGGVGVVPELEEDDGNSWVRRTSSFLTEVRTASSAHPTSGKLLCVSVRERETGWPNHQSSCVLVSALWRRRAVGPRARVGWLVRGLVGKCRNRTRLAIFSPSRL
jgi:hypothetical protein